MRSIPLMATLLFSSAGWSQESPFLEGPYLGLGLGFLRYEEKPTSLSFSDTAPLYKLYGGYRFNKRWAAEGYLATTATLKDDLFPGIPAGADFDTIEVRGLAHFGRFLAGIGYWDTDFSSAAMLAGPGNYNFSLIFGGEWLLNDWNFRLEAELFDTEDTDVPFFNFHRSTNAASLSFGAQHQFGRR
jgi:hypothetical protein